MTRSPCYEMLVVVTRPRSDVTTIKVANLPEGESFVVTRPRSDVTTMQEAARALLVGAL